jgi:hypothetical protein
MARIVSSALCNDDDRTSIPTQRVENRHRFERFARDVSHLLWPFFAPRGRRRVVQRVAAAASIVKSPGEEGLVAPASGGAATTAATAPDISIFFVYEHPLDERLSFLFVMRDQTASLLDGGDHRAASSLDDGCTNQAASRMK